MFIKIIGLDEKPLLLNTAHILFIGEENSSAKRYKLTYIDLVDHTRIWTAHTLQEMTTAIETGPTVSQASMLITPYSRHAFQNPDVLDALDQEFIHGSKTDTP